MRKRVAGRFAREDAGSNSEGQPAETGAKKRLLQPRHCQRYMRKRVAEAMPEIVAKFVEEAKKGSIPHAKILTTLGGLDKGQVVEICGRRRESLAAVLMKEWKRSTDQQG